MRKLTSSQRKKIYLDAYQVFFEGKNRLTYGTRVGMCSTFTCVLRKGSLSDYPEIQIFSPNKSYWFPYTNKGDSCRMTLLLLAAELCDDKKFQNSLKNGR